MFDLIEISNCKKMDKYRKKVGSTVWKSMELKLKVWKASKKSDKK